MTTSSGWDPDPTITPIAEPQHETTPIADELSATTGDAGASEDASAKQRAQDAADTAKQQSSEVASTAADEAKQVAGEAKAKATDLLSDVRTQVDEQSRTQLKGLASKLGELGDELDGLISGDGQTDGAVTDLARQLSDRTRALSTHLADREPSDLIADVRTFARRRPGAFIFGAAAAGLVAGRLTRGVKKANDQDAGTSAPVATPTASTTSTGTFPADTATYATDTSLTSVDVPDGLNTGGRQ